MPQLNNRSSAGFTLVEMLVIAPVALLAIGGFVAVMVSMVGDILATRDASTMTYSAQDSVNRIEQDVRRSAKFLKTTGTTSAQQGSDSNYTGTAPFTITSTNNTLILMTPSTDKNPTDNSRDVVRYANQPNPCGTTQTANSVFVSKIVYFIKNGSLWRRTILPPYNTNNPATANTVCASPWQQNTCSPNYSTGGVCQTNDSELMKNAQSLTVQYFADPASTTDVGVAGADTATTLKVTVKGTSKTAGRTAAVTQSVRATRINSLSSISGSTPPVVLAVTSQPSSLSVLSGDLNIAIAASSSVPTASVSWQRSSDGGTTWTDLIGQSSATLLLPKVDLGWNNSQLRAIFSNGADSVTTSVATLGVTTINWSALDLMTGVGDWDNDGKNDIAGYTQSNGRVYLYRGVGNGTFYGPTLMGTAPTTVRSLVGVGNAMSNGKPSLWWNVTAASSANQLSYIVTSDGGTKFAGAAVAAGRSGWGNNTFATYGPLLFSNTANKNRLINRTQDSGDDLFAYSFTGTSAPFLNTAPTSYGGGWHNLFPGDAVFGAGDWNQDGKGDILGRGNAANSGRLCLYSGDGNGDFTAGSNCSQDIDYGWHILNKVIGGWDYNGDTYPDILGRFTSNGTLHFYYNPGTGNSSPMGGATITQP